jgi:hypothetical protein
MFIYFTGEKYKKYIFRIIFYVLLIKNDKQTKKGKEINIFKSAELHALWIISIYRHAI